MFKFVVVRVVTNCRCNEKPVKRLQNEETKTNCFLRFSQSFLIYKTKNINRSWCSHSYRCVDVLRFGPIKRFSDSSEDKTLPCEKTGNSHLEERIVFSTKIMFSLLNNVKV